ncbi:MAG: M23 family metallopeptidase [Melioribacteraceae bacterium]|nr:M23 family metallopeptidase [Melioribacteraceae bacterium]
MKTSVMNLVPIFSCKKHYIFTSPIIFLFSVLLFLTLSCSEKSDLVAPVEESSITMDVTFAPIEVKSTNGKVNLVYSVEVSNFDKEGYKIKDFQAYNVSGNSMICSIIDTGKYLLIHKPLQESLSDAFYYYAGMYYATYRFSIGLVLDPSQVPQKIKHRLVLIKDGKEKIIEGTETSVLKGPIAIMSAPLKGERFVSANTTTFLNNHHPTYQLTYKEKTTVPERFCVDWNKIDETGSPFHGDQSVCENWYVYGQNVYAVADGIVVSVKDGMPDQSPVGTISNDLNLFNSDGNSVVIYIPGGYCIYGHFKPNSIVVKTGQNISKGDLIGQIGNSGNSGAPHLHFGLHTDFPYYISEGLPYYIDSLEKIGSTGKPGGPYVKLPGPEIHTNEIVENYGVYNLK